MSKLNLPLTLTGERIEYQRLYDLTGTMGRNMTTTGAYSFTSLSSGTTYSTTTGGEYNVFLQLQTVLGNYGIVDVDFNPLVSHLTIDASETVKGHVELATAAETTTGTDATRAVHPAGLKVELDKKIPLTQKGIANGVAILDSSVMVPASQVGAIEFRAGVFEIGTSLFSISSQSTTFVNSGQTKTLGAGGTLRFSMLLRVQGSDTAIAQVTRNGVPVGIERTTTSTTDVTFTEDISGWSVGDVIGVRGKVLNSTANWVITTTDISVLSAPILV